MEGASIRPSRPPPHRHPVIPNPLFSIQLPTVQSSLEGRENSEKSSHQNLLASRHRSSKENGSFKDKKRQLSSTSPKQERKERTVGRNNSCVHRSGHSRAPEQPLVVHTEPQRKARCLGLSPATNGAPLVTRTFSFSLSPPYNISESKTQPSPALRLHISRSYLPKTAVEPQNRIPTQARTSLHGPLPSLGILSLRPNIVARTITNTYPGFSSHSSFHRHRFFLHSSRQSTTQKKEVAVEEHKR